ncbi:hypothetical protein [Gilvimarinus sp. 1_MG-2023]|uniref:hypothetical protein n=1 Tax=Gilvimarinus sp. 1_MG-2023 TaxID=3062638 RepID=UPI0026E28496|nr:hypothetical protein [Gilvimarinus sp. 1_MG-2023]MDO6747588.1 hypothetical protein [Gilvimarinus sp. 1_MG-2023]
MIIACCIGLVACGGNSSGTGVQGPNNPDAVKQAQPQLFFSQSNITFNYGQTPPSNTLLGGAGEGSVSYSSSDTSVAAVNRVTGRLEPRKSGQTTITAIKAADANNLSTQASYSVKVYLAQQAPLYFEQAAIEQFIDDTPFNNSLHGGSGQAQTVFSSSAPDLVSIDSASGALTYLDDGTVTITAYRPANERYTDISSHYSVTVQKHPQLPLVFTEPAISAPISIALEALTFSGGSGNGAISFASSQPNIARINTDTGTILPLHNGTTDIQVIKAEDDYYAEAQGQYTLTVFDIISDLTVMLGPNSTRLSWTDQLQPFDLVRSTYDCNLNIIVNCGSYARIPFYSTIDSPYNNSVTIDSPVYFSFETDQYQSDSLHIVPQEQPFLPRTGNTLLSQDGKLWSFSGKNSDGDNTVSVWTSISGTDWIESEFTLSQSNRYQSATTLNGEIYLAGGKTTEYTHTISHLTDSGWVNLTEPAIDASVSSHLISYDNTLWLISSAGVWQSYNASDWTLVTDSPAFGARNDFSLFVYQDVLYLLGGRNQDNPNSLYSDVWSTTDGINWQLVTNSAGFPAQAMANIVTWQDTLYLLGGDANGPNADVYTSNNAVSWSKLGSANIGDLSQAAVTVDASGLLMTTPRSTFIWRSSNGLTWRTPINTWVQWQTR